MMIFIQIIGFAATAVNTLAFQAKKARNMLLLQALAGVIFGIHYCLLGGYTGGAMQFIFAANILVMNAGKKKENSSHVALSWAKWKGWKWIFCLIIIALSLYSWEGMRSILPCVCSIVTTLTNCSGNGKVIRLLRLFVLSPAWIINDILIFSISGIVLEAITIVSIIIFIIRFGWKNL